MMHSTANLPSLLRSRRSSRLHFSLPLKMGWLPQHRPDSPIDDKFADLRYLHRPPDNLTDKIVCSLELYPCQILFIHKDMDKEAYQARKDEIHNAFQQASERLPNPPQ